MILHINMVLSLSRKPRSSIDVGAAISGQHDNTSGKGIEGKDTGGVFGGNEF